EAPAGPSEPVEALEVPEATEPPQESQEAPETAARAALPEAPPAPYSTRSAVARRRAVRGVSPCGRTAGRAAGMVSAVMMRSSCTAQGGNGARAPAGVVGALAGGGAGQRVR
ncbi:hypothetical protein DLE01_22845, partial [Streptomyces sp. FT05W]